MAVKVVLGMSGGVDSAVSAWLLKEQGYDVTGVFMKTGKMTMTANTALAARTFSMRQVRPKNRHRFGSRELRQGIQGARIFRIPARVPGRPHTQSGRVVQFGNQVQRVLDYAMELGAEKIATGHYARVRQTDNGVELLRGLDGSKDQSYFLHRLNQKQLEKAIFPVGELPKTKVREIARMLDLSVAGKRIQPASALSASGLSANFSHVTSQRTPVRFEPIRAKSWANTWV